MSPVLRKTPQHHRLMRYTVNKPTTSLINLCGWQTPPTPPIKKRRIQNNDTTEQEIRHHVPHPQQSIWNTFWRLQGWVVCRKNNGQYKRFHTKLNWDDIILPQSHPFGAIPDQVLWGGKMIKFQENVRDRNSPRGWALKRVSLTDLSVSSADFLNFK